MELKSASAAKRGRVTVGGAFRQLRYGHLSRFQELVNQIRHRRTAIKNVHLMETLFFVRASGWPNAAVAPTRLTPAV